MTFNIFEHAYMIMLYSVGTELFNYFFIPVLSLSIFSSLIYLIKSFVRYN